MAHAIRHAAHADARMLVLALLARSDHSFSAGAFAKFQASQWGKKLAKQQATANMNDFERFKVRGGCGTECVGMHAL